MSSQIVVSTSNEEEYKKLVEFYHSLSFFETVKSVLINSKEVSKQYWFTTFDLFQNEIIEIPINDKSPETFLVIQLTTAAGATAYPPTKNTTTKLFSLNEDLVSQKEFKDPLNNVFTIGSAISNPEPNPAFATSSSTASLLNLTGGANSNIAPNGQVKQKIAVMTSGGDSPGMNAAVRAVVRTGIYYGCDMYAVYEGYKGLLEGGDLLKPISWKDVRGFLSEGGTLIGTARCMEFKERWGRKQAAKNLIERGINALVVCGGDGSLTGADLFRHEWPSLVKELVEQDQAFTPEQVEPYKNLTIVGLVGSIDNDMSGTDSTIGAYSALERIVEMVDYIDATAKSHSRAFVVEVMGRHCGWLALMAGIATGADYIFIPERPPKKDQWQAELKEVCQRHREKGRRNNTVIVAEGAIDDELNPITSEDVKKVLVEIGLDTRVTILGHVQRGGTAVAHDRWLATLQGVDAVKAVLENTPTTPSPLIGINENKIIRMPLVESVKLTKSVAENIENKHFDKAIALRDSEFIDSYENFIATTVQDDGSQLAPENERLNIAIVHVGAPTAALNASTRSAVLYCLTRGHKPYGISNGFSGLINDGEVKEMKWLDVENWHNLGGSEIGTNRVLPSEDLGSVAYQFQKNKFDGCIIIGGFEGFTALKELYDARKQYPIFNIPILLIPSTISNNVPGTEYSLGTDTCLNTLVNYTDSIKQSASATRRRVFVVEVQGGHSGYIASFSGLVSGAVSVYTPEKKIDLTDIQEDIALLKENFKHDNGETKSGKIVIRNEVASDVYTTQLVANIIEESSKGKFGVRTAIPGHVQQGGVPSSKDRIFASRFAVKCIKFIEDFNKKNTSAVQTVSTISPEDAHSLKFHYDKISGEKVFNVDSEDKSCCVICITGSQLSFKPIQDVWENETDLVLRKGENIHWEEMNKIGDIISGRLMLRRELEANTKK
ncbi:6-phosphofructokinase, alpha subunit [Hanseniaspora vineae]